MHRLIKKLSMFAFCMLMFSAYGEEKPYQAVIDSVQNRIGFEVKSIASTPLEGLLQVETDRGLFYISKDGAFIVQGRIFDVYNGMNNLTELSLSEIRKSGLQEFAASAIEFKAAEEKYVVHVFTDFTCGYCRKLHHEIDNYNAAGITVRYLAFPRDGMRGQAYQNLVSVWCSADQQKAMTDAKSGKAIVAEKCKNNVAEQYEFGGRVGVTRTPNIILPNGKMVPGYQPAKALLETLNKS